MISHVPTNDLLAAISKSLLYLIQLLLNLLYVGTTQALTTVLSWMRVPWATFHVKREKLGRKGGSGQPPSRKDAITEDAAAI